MRGNKSVLMQASRTLLESLEAHMRALDGILDGAEAGMLESREEAKELNDLMMDMEYRLRKLRQGNYFL